MTPPPDDRTELIIRYRLAGKSLAETGQLLGLSRQRIDQLVGNALTWIAVPGPTADEIRSRCLEWHQQHKEWWKQ